MGSERSVDAVKRQHLSNDYAAAIEEWESSEDGRIWDSVNLSSLEESKF